MTMSATSPQSDAGKEDNVIMDSTESIARITLNRPNVLNACDLETLDQFHTVLKTIKNDSSIRCVIITGAGRGFCVGADLNALRKRSEGKEGSFSYRDDLVHGFNPIIHEITKLDRPVIAMVNGVAAGAGLGIALACDIRFASQDAMFIEAFTKVGLVPDSGVSFFLPRYIGLSKSFELIYTGEGLTAEEALRYALVTRVFPAENLEAGTMEFARRVANGPTKALAIAKKAVNRALSASLEEALDFEAYAQDLAGRTLDHKEGVNAFIQKREARFSGQ